MKLISRTPSMHLVLPSALLADVQCDAMSLFFGAYQIHIVGNEELSSTGYSGAPRRNKMGGAKVRSPLCMFQL